MKMSLLLPLGALLLAVASCGGSQTLRLRESSDSCSQGGPAIPLRSFGQDAEAFRFERSSPTREHRLYQEPRRYVYRFEREPSGTTEALRAVFMEYGSNPIVVGDRGTALVRDPKKGWTREETGTEENLHAIVRAPYHPLNQGIDDKRTKRAPYIAVGAHGKALVRSADGVWRAEQTGTEEDLFDVHHAGTWTRAVGARGTLLERSESGVWRRLKTRTTADLYGLYGGIAVGAGGIVVDCRGDGDEPVCIPRTGVASRDLRAVGDDAYLFGTGVLLTPERAPEDMWAPPPVWKPYGGSVDSVPADDEIRAEWNNHYSDMGEHIAVGRRGAVWFVSNPFYREKPFERVQLPFGVDLHGVAFDLVDGWLVGDKGTIVHLAVDGITIPTICLL